MGKEARAPARSSRLCIKNLPKHITEARFREVFAAHGDVTDAKIVSTKSGHSRRMGFIGYRTVQEAAKARGYFDQTFIDTSRITVEFALAVGDNRLSRPWSQHSKGSSRHEKKHPELYERKPENEPGQQTEKVVPEWKAKLDALENNPKFQEFISVMKPRNKSNFWDNDTVEVVSSKKRGGDGVYVEKVHRRFDEGDSAAPSSEPVVQPEPESDSDTDDEAFNNPGLDDDDVMDAKPAPDAPSSDSDDDLEPIDDDEDESEEDADEGVGETGTANDQEAVPPPVCDSARLFVRNLCFSVTEDELAELFRPYGQVTEVNVPVDDLGRSKGFAQVQFANGVAAVRALEACDGRVFQGRLMHVMPAFPRPEPKESQTTAGARPARHKDKVAASRKANANDKRAWNSLFVRSDTVASATASSLNVDKSALFDADAKNVAVTLALAETSVIADTKAWLAGHAAVNVSVFEGERDPNAPRSETTILVKNIPFDCEEQDINALFAPFGNLARCVLPPSRAFAIVEFVARPAARRAFSSLAYSKFRHVPLYLEWAPRDIWSDAAPAPVAAVEVEPPVALVDDVDEPSPSLTLFIKNINFATTEDSLRSVFCTKNGTSVRSVVIARHTDAKRKGLSRGYGFVEFATREAAMDALKTKQGVQVDGHALQLSMSSSFAAQEGRGQSAKRSRRDGDLSNTKLLVKNVPFEANIKELRDLFSSFGRVKSCRIPSKFGGGHRGFAFVEFCSAGEAQAAKASLEATHFYGRHLVLEWASRNESIDELRQKAAESGAAPAQKQRRTHSPE
ncbi:hypothetical protein PBRA_007715 [Plasmodiophora brassicae]|uniref:RRM domain-containing protein n=1 Tax=Plasmodiophora brassicae TaxID=37360 RepID=A0A0G4IY29_PLABS|nr:hypothetical protein PBRA_007715 [Plasmodiophora brassicae]